MKKTDPIKNRLQYHLELLEKLDSLKLEVNFAREQYSNIKIPSYSGIPGGGGAEKLTEPEARVFEVEKLEEKIRDQKKVVAQDWQELEPLIEQLKPIEALVLKLRYCYGGEWDDICEAIFGKRKHFELELDRYKNKMFKIHGRALVTLAEIYEEKSNTNEPTE